MYNNDTHTPTVGATTPASEHLPPVRTASNHSLRTADQHQHLPHDHLAQQHEQHVSQERLSDKGSLRHEHTHNELQSSFVDPITIHELAREEKFREAENEKAAHGAHGAHGEPIPVDELLDEEEIRRRQEAKPLFGKRSAREFGIHLTMWLLLTGFTIALWVLGHDNDGKKKDGYIFWTVCWAFVTLRFIARHVCISKLIWNPLGRAWNATAVNATKSIPRQILFGTLLVVTLACMLLTALFTSSDESTRGQRVQSWAGVLFILSIGALSSRNRKAINLQTISVGIFLQFVFGLLVLKWQTGTDIFQWFSNFINNFLGYSHGGLEFLLGPTAPTSFAVNVLPAIIFFCSFIQVVYYWGGMQYLVQTLGRFMMYMMDTSGAESIVAAASPFVGQVENALLVLPFVEYMTRSELHAIMCCGFATISGSVLAGYVAIVGDARLILTACIMSIPASLVLTKLRYPEEEPSITKGKITVPPTKEKDINFLHAAGNGAATGAQLVILISATLLALISLYNAANDLVGWCFDMLNIHRPSIIDATLKHPDWISISFILSYPFLIVAWFLGVSGNQARLAGEVMAQKMVVNEFFAYSTLKDLHSPDKVTGEIRLDNRAFHILAFALCGFANIGSIGIQVSALGAISPNRKKELAQLAVSAMLLGTLATWMTAAVAGTMI
ncbi:Na+ dependent nucleoside transporter C-terminus-domain-containing protein [Geranomyces variabilis]|nr:Na+ dependent nucleoside transporter C-terminus-domain-containing protein [Geranomyces variabilis]KAJ3139916.1 hypothetical protein HDU90_008816 [Geranomyces variabilis]